MIDLECFSHGLFFLFLFCFLGGTEGWNFRASHLQSRHSTAQTMPPVYFHPRYFRDGQAGLKSQSFLSQPHK
jgi:hypothetical protein